MRSATASQLEAATATPVLAVAQDRQHGWLAAADSHGRVHLWNPSADRFLFTLFGHHRPIWSLQFLSPNRLVTAGHDGTVRLWSLEAKREHLIVDHQGEVLWAVGVSPDGQLLASGGDSGHIHLWDVESGEPWATFPGHREAVLALAFAPNGWLISGGADRCVRIWDVEAHQEIGALTDLSGAVNAVAVTPDSERLATGTEDMIVSLWNLSTRQLQNRLEGHSGLVEALSLSANGRTLATASQDWTIRLWDLESGRNLATLTGHQGPVWSVAFGAQDSVLASGSEDGTVRLWDRDEQQCQAVLRP